MIEDHENVGNIFGMQTSLRPTVELSMVSVVTNTQLCNLN